MSEEQQGPKELRDRLDRAKERIAHLESVNRGFVLEKAGVPDKSRNFVTKALGDDADWDDPESIKNLLTEQGLTFGASGEQVENKQTPEDKERLAAQGRIDEMRNSGAIPSGAAPSIKDQIADAESEGNTGASMALKAQQMLKAAGM